MGRGSSVLMVRNIECTVYVYSIHFESVKKNQQLVNGNWRMAKAQTNTHHGDPENIGQRQQVTQQAQRRRRGRGRPRSQFIFVYASTAEGGGATRVSSVA